MRIVTDEKDRQAYKEFLEKHERCNFQQSPEWAKVKSNWKNEVVLAEDKNGKIIGAVSILIRKIPIFGNIMYSSRGPTCDIHDFSVMKQLTDGIRELAKKYNLPYKQVVAPYFEGTGEESLNPNAETKFRISVIAVIKNEKDNTYLCVDALKRNCKSFVLGGIEEGETPEEAAIREVKEETGYIDIKINRKSILELHNHFYAEYKGVNRYATLNVIFGILKSKKRERVSEDEFNKQKAVWVKKENLKNFLTVNNNVFVNEYLLDGDCAYEGDGIMINSGKLNGKLRSDVIV